MHACKYLLPTSVSWIYVPPTFPDFLSHCPLATFQTATHTPSALIGPGGPPHSLRLPCSATLRHARHPLLRRSPASAVRRHWNSTPNFPSTFSLVVPLPLTAYHTPSSCLSRDPACASPSLFITHRFFRHSCTRFLYHHHRLSLDIALTYIPSSPDPPCPPLHPSPAFAASFVHRGLGAIVILPFFAFMYTLPFRPKLGPLRVDCVLPPLVF